MRKLSNKEKQQLEEKYGSRVDDEQYLAGYFAKVHKIIYYVPEKHFYLYMKKKGVWSTVSDEKLIDIIGQTIHKYAVIFKAFEVEKFRTVSKLTAILKLLKGQVENKDAFAKRKGMFVHLANTMLEYNEKTGEWEVKDFSPEYYSRNQSPIPYNPNKKWPKFLKLLLKNAMTDDDIEHLQMYLGQCLLRVNLSQMFLLLIGMPGGGKSTLVNVIEGLVGRWNCTELRLKHISGRFEIYRTNGKSLLTAKDVDSEFMTGPGAGMLKALTGNDTMTAEPKNSNDSFDVIGNFNVIITSNAQLRIKLDSDIDAWRRRLLIIKYKKNANPKRNCKL